MFYLQRRFLLRHVAQRDLHLHRLPQLGADDLGQIGPRPVADQMALLRFEGQQYLVPCWLMTELMAS